MDFKHLRTFVAVVDNGTVSKAAQELRIAQPALSRQISDLESELGVALFNRFRRRLVLTAAGQQLLADSRDLLGQFESWQERARLLGSAEIGLLKVAASPIQIESVLSTFLPIYARRYPKVEVRLVESVGNETLVLLERGDIQLGISPVGSLEADRRNIGLYQMPPLCLLAAYHPALGIDHKKTCDIRRIATFPLLLLDSTYVIRRTFDAACRLARLTPKLLIESRAPHTILALAETKLGIAVIGSATRTRQYKLRTVQIAYDRKVLQDPLAIIWDKRRPRTPYSEDFCRMLVSHMRRIVRRDGA
jgi:DNA-binding transcriptional LysR family regulator